MRTTNRYIALALLLALAALPARADAAKKKAAAAAADKADKADDADESSDPEVKLPPILLKALHEKEAEVTAARREAISLLESYLRDSPHSKEQAEAMYKLAELYWEESKDVYLEKMGQYQDAVAACHADRASCPKVPRTDRRPSTCRRRRRSICASSTTIRSSARSTRSSTSTRSRCATRGSSASRSKYFQTILDKYPRSRYIADAWMAIAEYRFYEQQNYKSSLEAYEKVLQHPKSQLYDLALFKTAWCYWKLGDTEQVGAALQGRARSGQEEGGADGGAAEARRRAAGPGARLPRRAVHRGRHQERARRVRVPGADRRQAVLAQGAQAAGRHRVRPDRATSAPSRPTGC